MKNPILLDGHTLNPGAVLWPVSMGIKRMADGLTSVSMTLPPDSPDITLGDWLRVTTPQDEALVLRVTSVKRNTAQGGGVSLAAEHAFGILKDSVTGAKINEEQADMSAGDALRALFAAQKEPIWTLDRCDFTEALPWSFPNASIYNNLQTLTESLEEPQWEFDLSALPFKASLVKRPTSPSCEMRLSRNISTISITVDRTGMYTRLYPVGMNELGISAVNGGVPYIERNTSQYSVIEETVTNSAIDNDAALLAWAGAQLARNCVPAVTISITGREISKRTGVPMDRLVVGTVCRVALPEEHLTVAARITTVEWKDAVTDEESVDVTLANEHRTVQGILKRIQDEVAQVKRGSGGSGAAQKKENENLWTRITQTESEIALEAYRLDQRIDGNTANIARLSITADQIESVAAKYNYDSVGDLLESYYSQITQNADNILLRVAKTDYNGETIASLINVGTNDILIQANRINLSGYVTASQLSAELATFQKNFTANASIMILELGTLRYRGHEVSLKTQTVVTSVSGKATGLIAVRDADGNIAGTAVTGISVTYGTTDINYLAYE
ncbi:MAG: phage tail protein [Clostridiales bacterium]|nr:phage tail protein [Clostridiales bacterium]MDY5514860.1 phage tail spike protein [Candidatus Ventricola sp.]